MAMQGRATVADGSTEGLCSPCCSLWRVDQARRTSVRRVVARSGRVRRDAAIAADGSKEHLGVPCCSLCRVDEACCGVEWRGGARQGKVRRGNVR